MNPVLFREYKRGLNKLLLRIAHSGLTIRILGHSRTSYLRLYTDYLWKVQTLKAITAQRIFRY